MDGKAEARAELLQLLYTGARAMPKAEVVAFVQAAYAQRVHQDGAHKILCAQAGERRIERHHQHGVNARFRQQAHALVHRRQQPGRAGRAQKLLGVRIEGNGHRAHAMARCFQCTRFRHHSGENLAVARMHTVEVADGGHRRTKTCRDLLKRSVDLHLRCWMIAHWVTGPRLTDRVSPSWARLTPAGKVRLVASWPRSWAMWVNQVWRAPIRSVQASACSTVEWLGWGL